VSRAAKLLASMEHLPSTNGAGDRRLYLALPPLLLLALALTACGATTPLPTGPNGTPYIDRQVYLTDPLIDLDGKGWPACPRDLDAPDRDQERRRLINELYEMMLARMVKGTVSLDEIEAQMDAIGCLWTPEGKLAVVYDWDSVAHYYSITATVGTAVLEFEMVQIWGGRFNGEWWPQAFLCTRLDDGSNADPVCSFVANDEAGS
jgi:hypothetical protein